MGYRKSGLAAIAALSLGFASLVGSTPAQAQHGGGHGGGHYGGHGGYGGGFATGLALGAYGPGYGYDGGYGGGYGYGGHCFLRRRVVGYRTTAVLSSGSYASAIRLENAARPLEGIAAMARRQKWRRAFFFADGGKSPESPGFYLVTLVVMLRSAAFVASTLLTMTALFDDDGPAVAAIDSAIVIPANLH